MDTLRTIERARTAVVLLALAATPLIVFTQTYDQFLLPKYVWVKLLTILLAVLTAARLAFGGDVRVRLHWLNVALLAFVLWKAVSWFWAQSRSLAGDDIRWWVTLFVWCLLFQDWLGAERRRIVLCAGALSVSALLLSLWILVQDFAVAFYGTWQQALAQTSGGLRDAILPLIDHLTGAGTAVARLPDWRGHLWAGLGNTNHIADFIALTFPASAMLYLLATGKAREILMLATLVASAAALVVCWSVGSNGGLILAGLIMLFLLFRHEPIAFWRKRLLRIGVALILFGLVVAFYVLPHRFNPHPGGIFEQAFGSDRWHEGWPTRVAIWLTSLEVVKAHPLLGIGAGNFTYGYTAVLSPAVLTDPQLVVYAGAFTNAAHNELLQAWVETGIVGTMLLVALWLIFLRKTGRRLGDEPDDARRLRTVVLAMMIAFIAHSMMNFALQLPTSSLMMAAMIGVAASIRAHGDEFALGVRQSFGPVELDIETAGMRWIESIGLRLEASNILRGAIFVGAAVLGLVAALMASRPLVADIHFRYAKEYFRSYEAMGVLSPDVEPAARRAIAANRHHHHAWKILARCLLQKGRYAEAREAYALVARRETVYDFYGEWGYACLSDNDRKGAARAWTLYFSRRPELLLTSQRIWGEFKSTFPKEAAAVLDGVPDEFFKAWALADTPYRDLPPAGEAWRIYFSRRPEAIQQEPDFFRTFSERFPEIAATLKAKDTETTPSQR